MLTNLLATITFCLVTNTTEVVTEYESYVPTSCPDGRMGCLVYHTKGVNPKAKDITTSVELVRVATFDWDGVKHSVTNRTVMSTSTVHKRLEWTEREPDRPLLKYNSITNWIVPGENILVFTNDNTYVIESK